MLTRGLSPAAVLSKTLAAATLLLVGVCGPLVAQGTQESQSGARSPALARVFDAWKAREDRIKSFYFVWNLRVALPKGYEFPNVRGLAGVRKGNVALDKDKDVEFVLGDAFMRTRSIRSRRSRPLL